MLVNAIPSRSVVSILFSWYNDSRSDNSEDPGMIYEFKALLYGYALRPQHLRIAVKPI
jgi:hypothetical protein